MKEKTPVLYVHSSSNYKQLPRFDCYDENRDALTYRGVTPVIAHPPCRNWSRLKAFSKGDNFESLYAFHALKLVRTYGGILEHPYDSSFWSAAKTVKPGSYDAFGGFTIVFDQRQFGYYTRKRTRLYIVGCKVSELPPMPLNFNAIERKFENLSPRQRSETTTELIKWFSQVIDIIKANSYDNNIFT